MKLNSFVKKNLTKVLLLAVLLTSVFSMRNVAYGKYVDWLADYSQVIAEDFHFTSDSLKSTDKKYNISKWISNSNRVYNLTFEVRNYDNSLLWNESGTNLFYYIDAKVYNDADLSSENTDFTIEYVFPNGALVGTYMEHDVACIKGMSSFSKNQGLHQNSIRLSYPEEIPSVPNIAYLEIKAVSIPYSEISEITLKDGVDVSIVNDCNGNIYYEELSALYNLGVGSSDAGFSHELEQDINEYLVRFFVRSKATTDLKIYYNPEILLATAVDSGANQLEVGTEKINGRDVGYMYINSFSMERTIQLFKHGSFLNKEITYAIDRGGDSDAVPVMSSSAAISSMCTPLSERTAGAFYPDIFVIVPEVQ